MYGQEVRQRRSFDDIMGDVEAEFSAPAKPSARPKARKSFDDIADEVGVGRYGPPVTPDMLSSPTASPETASAPDSPVGKPMMFTAPDVDASGRETGRGMVTTKPEGVAPLVPKRDPRQVQAARVARQINDLKKQSVSFFQQADQSPDTPANGGLNAKQQLRAKAEGSLEQANMLAKDAQGRYGDLLEVGYGNDADPDSKRKWAYAKVKPHAADALVEQDRMRLREHDARTMDALNVSPEAKARFAQDRKDDILRNIVGAVNPAVGLGDALANLGITEPREGVNRFYRGATNMLASLPEGAARMVDRVLNTGNLAEANALQKILDADTSLSPEERQATQQKIQQLYGSLSNLGDTPAKLTNFGEIFTDTAYPIDQSQPDTYNPLKSRFYTRTLPAAAGSMLPFMASAAAGGAVGLPAEVVAGLTGAAGEVPGQFREAKAAGANPQQQARAVDAGMLAGFLESFGAESLMGKLPGKGRLSGIAKEALQEGIQEGAQQAVENVGAKYYAGYDPNRPLTEDVLANAVPALFLGGAGGAASHVSGHTQEHQTAQNRNIIDARSAANAAALQNGTAPTLGIVPTTIGPTQITKLPGARPAVTETQNQPAVAPATPQAVTTPSTPQPTASLFPEAQPVAPPPDLTKLSPQERTAALLDQLRQQQEGRGRATLEQSLNQEFTEAGGMVTAAAQNWDTDRPTAEQLAATGAQRLKTALNTLQKSEPYQAELAAVSQGTGQPGAYIGAAQRLQQQIAQADGLFRLDAEREQQQADAEKAQKKADKEAAKQERIQLKEQAKLDRQTAVQQRRDESAARRMQAAETAKTVRRKQLEEQRQQARDTKVQQRADAELQRMGRHDAALKAADEANRRHQEYLNQGMIPEAVNELVVQQNQLRDAVRYLPATPQSQNIKADLNRYQGQIGNRIGDLRKQARGQSGPVTEAIPPLLRPDAVVNESGGVPNLPSFYRPGAVFDKLNPTLGDVEEETTPMLTAVRRLGGIRNDQITPGELRRLGIKESGTTGLVNEKGGLAPDRMREALVESGYLPEDSTVDDLFQAIEGEMRAGRRNQRKDSISDFYDQWEAESGQEDTGDLAESLQNIPNNIPGSQAVNREQRTANRNPIEQFANDIEADDRAALDRAISRSQRDNPRPYDERTRPGEPGSGLVSFSEYAELERRNVEPERALYENEPTSETFKDAVEWITEDAAKAGIGKQHADAMIAYALNWHGEKAFWESRGLSMNTVQQAIDSLDAEMDSTRRRIANLPPISRTEAEREIAALDSLFDDPDAVNLLERIIRGEDNAADEFRDYAATEFGLSGETISDLVRVRRPARSADTERTQPQGAESQGDARRSETRPEKSLNPLHRLLSQNPSTIPDAQFDAYLRDLEGWRNEGIHGSGFGGVDLAPSLERSLRQKLATTNEERKIRVKENRLKPKQTPLPIPTRQQRAERQELIAETRDLSPEEQQRQLSELRQRQRESGKSAQPIGKEESGRAMREQIEREARTVTHSDPAIDGKPILAETQDGRVIVENANNVSGISIVKNQPGQIAESATPQSERGRLAYAVADHLASGGRFANIIEARKFIAQQTGQTAKAGTIEAKQVDEAIEAGTVIAARRIVAEGRSARETFQSLLGLYNRQPNLNARTSTSMIQQAYSTPLPLAYVAAQLAGINQNTTVYEPSAGHSALLVTAKPENVIANELNAERAAAVRDILPGAKVTEHDAADWKPAQSVDRVITNPPFGPVKDANGQNRRFKIDGKYETSEIDHAIAFEALQAMKDDGKAVLIVAGLRSEVESARSNAYNTGAKRDFYFTLYNQYNVTDHFTVAGELYNKQGAGWPVDVIVIDGRGKSQRELPAVAVPQILRSWGEVEGKLNAASSRNSQSAESTAENVRLGERGLSASERSSGASRRTADNERVPVVSDRPSERDVEIRRNAGAVDAGVSDQSTGTSRPVKPASESSQSRRGVERSDLQQRPAARPVERAERVSEPDNAQQGQSAGETTGRADKPGTVDQRTDRGAGRTSDVGSVFDEEFEKLFGEAAPSQAKPTESKLNKTAENVRETKNAQPLNRTERTTKEAAKSAAKESKDTLKEIAKGLSDLFGGPKLSSGLTFDEKTYAAAKPHFEAAMEHFQQATRDVREVMANLLKELNQRFGFQPDVLQRMKPYTVRFVEEKTATPTESAIRSPQSAIEQATQTPATTTSEADAGASDTHRTYAPASSQKSVGTLVPVNMADAVNNSLNRLKDEVGNLDDYVGEKLGYKADDLGQYLSGEQVDAVAMAIRNIENGGALILGDQTGIGKGRVVAAVIRYAVKQGLTPVFVTEKPTLYGDMIRDLTDIGSESIKPLITNSGESVPLDDDALDWYGEAEKARLEDRPVPKKRGRFLETKAGPEHNALLKRAADSGNLAGHHVIFTTYNQMQTVKGQTTARHDLLRRFANNGIVIFDESHNAGGAGKVETDDKGEVKFDRAQFARQLARDAKGLLYSSATFAKRPEVMDLYFRTELGNAVGNLAELSEITQKGGVPMQQVIASMLAEAGQYVRRERSFKGVEYAPTPTKVDRKTAENVSRAMREVADFDRIKQGSVEALGEQVKKEAKRITGDGTVGQAGVHSVNFTSLMHNLIDQSLLAMKVDQAADMAIKALENGEKPVITVANTMGSFIQRFAEENELKPGAPINLSFNDLLDRYLERSREVIVGKPYGEKQRHYLSDEELGEGGVRAYEKAKKTLQGLNLDIPISPIDWLHKRLRDAGYRTGEITGRGHIVNYKADGPVYTTRPASETSTAAKKRAIAAFNDGTIDVIILNQSGSTGISLHASEKFKDQRRRHMIIAQAEKNIDTHMQMLGRVHRTGQVIPPRYTQMVADIPAELRPAAVLAKKMASLNANTTASRSSAVTAKDVPDFLNKYGDEVAASMMESNPDLHALLGYPLKDSEKKEGLEREDAMRKVTGRIPLLPIAQQEQAYEDLIDEYNYTLQQAEAMGENALEAKTLNLDAETTKTQTLVPGSGQSLFEQAANLEKIRSNRQGKPFTSSEVLEKVQASTANDARNLVILGRAGKEQIRSQRGDLEAEVAAFKHRMDEEHGDTKRGAVEQLAADKWLNRWNQITGTVYPGATVQVAGGYGVVLNIERKGKTANPVALSGWRATIALADARRQLLVPFSKIDFETTDQPNRVTILPATEATVYDPEKEDFARVPILDAFDKGLSSTKETRYMVTGNLIAGFGAQPNGQIVNFTDNEGRVRQGILMPAKFDPAEVAGKQKQRLKTVDDVITALTGPVGEVTDRTGDLSIRKAPSGGYVFSVPSAKGRGGKYYLNRSLLDAAETDFAKRGGRMEVQVRESFARRMIDTLLTGKGMATSVSLQAKAPQIAERRGGAPFTDRYTVRDLAANATAEYRPASNRPGAVYLNDWGHALVRDTLATVYGEGVAQIPGDFTLDTAAIRNIADGMQERAGGAFADIANALKTAADDADANGRDVAIVTKRQGQSLEEIKRSVRHETVHAAQSAIDPALTGAATEAWLSSQPKASKIRAELARRGYADNTHGYEAVAYVASGDFGVFGLSLDEATDLLDSYYRATVRKFGASALEKFGAIDPKLQPTLEGVRREAQFTGTAPGSGAENTGRSSRETEQEIGRRQAGAFNSTQERQGRTEGLPRVAERKDRRSSFGELEKESRGTVLGSGFGGLQSLTGQKTPRTTPLREIIAEHRPLVVNPLEIQNRAIKEVLDAAGRGVAGTLPGARALYWAKKLKAKPIADKLANRQARFIEDAITKTNQIISASEAMNAAGRGSSEYQKAKADFYKARRELHNQLQRIGEYSGPVEYLTKYAKGAILTAPHILTNNVLDHLASFPFHEAQKLMGFLLPVRALRRWGVDVERTHVDFRDLVPALAREFGAILKGTKDAMPDFVHALRYGTTDLLLDEEIAREQLHQTEEERQTGGADRYELGKRAKGVPGLDQALSMVGRMHGAVDVAGRRWAFATAITSQADAIAKRVGKENGFSKEDIAALREDLAAEPSPQMIVLAMDEANRFVLDYPTFLHTLVKSARTIGQKEYPMANKAFNNALDFIVKFQKIPLAAQAQSLWHYTPMGLVSQAARVRRAAKAKAEGKPISARQSAEIVERLQQGALGTLVWAGVGLLGSLGYLQFTGGDDRQRVRNAQEALEYGYDPELIVGDKALTLNKLGTFGRAASVAARLAKAAEPRRDAKTGEMESEDTRAKRVGKAFMKGVVFDNPIGRGVGELVTSDSGDPLENFARGQIRSLQPGFLRDVAKLQDGSRRIPDKPDFQSKVEADLKTGNPWYRQTLQPRKDALGQNVPEDNPFSFYRTVKNNPQLEEMIRLGTGLPKPKRERGESSKDYNQRVEEQGSQTIETMRKLAADTRMAGRSDQAKARIYNTELTPSVMKRADKLSDASVETEREIEAIRADAYEALRKLPTYQAMKDSEKEKARGFIDAQLKGYRARAANKRAREKSAQLPEFQPFDLAQSAVEQIRP